MTIETKRVGPMPGIPLDALLDAIRKQGEEYIADGHEHSSQLFLLRKTSIGYAVETIAIAPLPGDQAGKDTMADALAHLVEPYDAYIFLTEAYFIAVKSLDEIEGLIGKIKDQPNRVEVFQLHFVSKLGESKMLDWEILRPEGQAPRFGKRREAKSTAEEGRFANFYLRLRKPGEVGN